jgi:hypothetical protein
LLGIEFCGEPESLRVAGGRVVGELQAAAGLCHQGGERELQSSRQEEMKRGESQVGGRRRCRS